MVISQLHVTRLLVVLEIPGLKGIHKLPKVKNGLSVKFLMVRPRCRILDCFFQIQSLSHGGSPIVKYAFFSQPRVASFLRFYLKVGSLRLLLGAWVG